MNRIIILIIALLAVVGLFFIFGGDSPKEETPNMPEVTEGLDPENTLVLELSTGGPVVIQMFPEIAPNHVARFKELTREGYYDGVVFHRVIDGFMAQTGDPTGTGSGGSGQNIKAEFNEMHHDRGVVSTARAGHPDSADSQFFMMLAPSTHLDGQYTAWGKIVEGMDFVDAVQKGPSHMNGEVPEDKRDRIISMKVAADEE